MGNFFTPKQDAVLHEALERYGQHEQEQMAIGEIGELLTMFGRKVQGRLTTEAMVDEIADVTIMVRQLAHLYGLGAVTERIDFKIERLTGKLERSRS